MSGTLGRYFYDVQAECPYGRPFAAIYRQALFHVLPAGAMEFFLAAGFRRNGNYLYTMVCPDCQSCVPIRLDPERFVTNRCQRRVWRLNQDLTTHLGPLAITSQKLALCDKFLDRRYPGKGSSALDYYAGFFINSLGATQELEFWLDDRLAGVSIVDIYPEAVNCVYFYFDPDLSRRSLGTNNILTLLEFARQRQIPYLYLGYWIAEVQAMRYKSRFSPHFLLQDGEWVEHGGPTPATCR